ncbi:MAG: RluA family pseudouridine synthase [Kiritimatiellia bacterium]
MTRKSSLTALRADNNTTLLSFLSGKLGISRSKAKKLLDNKTVFVNRRRTWMAQHRLQAGDTVEFQADGRGERFSGTKKAKILYEDADCLVINKPPGRLSTGRNSIEAVSGAGPGNKDIQAVHRLDRDTSGCLLLAKHSRAARFLTGLFRKQRVRKEYRAIARGRLTARNRPITAPVRGKPALSRVTTVSAAGGATLVMVTAVTGRTHQVRKHLASIGHPVIGDKYYGARLPQSEKTLRVTRQMLDACLLEFVPPGKGKPVTVKAPMPDDFRQCLKKYGLREQVRG